MSQPTQWCPLQADDGRHPPSAAPLQGLHRLRDLDEVLAVIAAAVDAHDPCTATHQRRVSGLAAALARELELDEESVAGLRVTGLVHDVGKLVVPAQILRLPRRLTALEFRSVKAHAAAGWEILAPIAFPWPVAEVVLQHHERLNGSGYPRSLRGRNILLGARILAVADVVEAMVSQRPYHAPIDLLGALAEIEGGKGTRYDGVVVDACARLVRGERFRFGDESCAGADGPPGRRVAFDQACLGRRAQTRAGPEPHRPARARGPRFSQ